MTTWPPPKEEDHRHPTTFLLTKKEYADILQFAEETGKTTSDLIVESVAEYMHRYRAKAKAEA